MQKDFDSWNEVKKTIENKIPIIYFHERQSWWCTLGINIGNEQDGSGILRNRPVIILKVLSKRTCLVIPLTSSLHEHPMRINVGLVQNKISKAIISQMRVIDTARFTKRIGMIDTVSFELIKKTVKKLF